MKNPDLCPPRLRCSGLQPLEVSCCGCLFRWIQKETMNNRLLHTILAFGLVLGLVSATAQAQAHPKSATTKAAQSRGESGAKDENIKQDRAANDPNAKMEAPPEKGGPKTRQAACRVHIDNRTPWYIDVYTDGNYRGQVSPYGDSYGWVGCGGTVLYGRATFTDGSVKTWGPSNYYIDGTFTWSLTF